MRIDLPCDTKTVPLIIGEQNLEKVVISHISEASGEGTQEEMVRRALERPVGTPRLRELARGKKRVVLVTSDHTRAVPSKITLPILLAEIRAGNPDAEITILIATGLHRETTREEQIRMFGSEIVERERILVNRAFEKDEFVSMGGAALGGRVLCEPAGRGLRPAGDRGIYRAPFFCRFLRREKEYSSGNLLRGDGE